MLASPPRGPFGDLACLVGASLKAGDARFEDEVSPPAAGGWRRPGPLQRLRSQIDQLARAAKLASIELPPCTFEQSVERFAPSFGSHEVPSDSFRRHRKPCVGAPPKHLCAGRAQRRPM